MHKCGFCGKAFNVPETKCQTYIRELSITCMCPQCFESTFNTPVVSDWGDKLGHCNCCDRPIYQKDIDKRTRCQCGESFSISLSKKPETKEEWSKAFENAVALCPRMQEVGADLINSITTNTCAATVNNALLTMMYSSPIPEGEDPDGLDYIMTLLEHYVMKNWD